MFFGFHSNELAPADAARLRRIEQKLDLILQQLGIKVEPDPRHAAVDGEVRALAAEGKKIEAIKRYREQTGADLRTAKEFVESLM